MNNITIIISVAFTLLFSPNCVAEQCLMPKDPTIKHEIVISPSLVDGWVDSNIIVSRYTKNIHVDVEGSIVYYPVYKKIQKASSNGSLGYISGTASYVYDSLFSNVKDVANRVYQYVQDSDSYLKNITQWYNSSKHKYKDNNQMNLEIELALENAVKNKRDADIKANQDKYKECEIDACFLSNDPSSCIKRGNIISDYQKEPCVLSKGVGLLIKAVPNRAYYVQEDIKMFFLKLDKEQNYISVQDINIISENAGEMKLYVKFLGESDSFNGSYKMYLGNDIKESSEFLSSAFKHAHEVLSTSSKKISEILMHHTDMNRILIGLMTIYLSISGFLFSSGIIKHKAADMLKHYMKLCIICTLADSNIVIFFLDLARSMFVDGSKELADMIMNIAVKIVNDSDNIKNVNTSMLSVYDSIIDSYFTFGLHLRIWSLLFTKYAVVIPVAYVIIITFILACIRSAVLYLIALTGFSLLFAIAPIMICLAFSRFSKDLFNAWTRSIINCGLVNIFLSISLGIFAVFLFNYAFTPFDYVVCGRDLIESKYISSLIGNMTIWQPKGTIDLTIDKLLIDLIVVLIFKSVISAIPQFVESIAPSIFNPLSSYESQSLLSYVTLYSDNVLSIPTHPISSAAELLNGSRYAYNSINNVRSSAVELVKGTIRNGRYVVNVTGQVFNRITGRRT